jgi:hypothetical protein
MKRRRWSVPAIESSQAQAGAPSDAPGRSRPSQWGGREFAGHFIIYTVFFGLIGAWFSSWFPIALGAFLFFTDDDFIEWVLWKVGIRLVPNTLGAEFVKAFIFLIGLFTLLAYWKDSAPAWLSSWIPPNASWFFIGAAALVCAVLKTSSAAVIKKLLPRVGIEIAPNRQNSAILGLMGLGVLALISIPMIADWLGGH